MPTMIYRMLKSLYFLLPFKRELYVVLRRIYKPSKKLSGYLKFKGAFKFDVHKHKVSLYNNNSTLASLLFWHGGNGYEEQSIDIWVKLSNDSNVVFDVGANFGLFGLMAKTVNASAQVHFFEPLKRNAELIDKNLQINKFNNSFVEVCAVSNYNGEAVFYDVNEVENTVGSFDINFIKSHKPSKQIVHLKVPVVSLDSYMELNKLNKVDLVKIDVEGAEVEVIEGFRNGLRLFQPNILIELSTKETARKVNHILLEAGLNYKFFEIDEEKGLIQLEEISKGRGRNYLICRTDLVTNI